MQNSQYIEEYFTPSAWKLLSEYEKRRLENLKANYELLKSTGITPKIPDFMKNSQPKKQKIQSKHIELKGKNIQKAKLKLFAVPKTPSRKKETVKIDEFLEVDKKLPTTSTKSNEAPLPSFRTCPLKQFAEIMLASTNTLLKYFESPSFIEDISKSYKQTNIGLETQRRYPKGSIERKIYKEEDVSSDDEFLHCDDCGKGYKGACTVHDPMILVCDTKVPKGDPDRARKSLPHFLSVSRSIIPKAGLGIWTEMFLSKGMVFGPYQGTKHLKHKEVKDSGYAWQVRKGGVGSEYVEGADASTSNWMRYVNCASMKRRQNVVAFQFRKGVYYKTYKDVLPHTELLVWYGDGYAKELGIDLTEDTEPPEKEVGGYACDLCDSLFSSSSALEGHRKKHPHMQHDRRHKCPHCAYSTDEEANLRRHLLTHTGGRPHVCTHCHKGFTVKSNLQNHLRLHTGEKPYSCDTCGRGFNVLSSLCRHERTHTGERRHRCATCGKDFDQAGNLKGHVRMHTLQRPYRCPHCDYRASVSSKLRRHIVSMHTREFKHKCPVCGKGFIEPSSLKKHAEYFHKQGEK